MNEKVGNYFTRLGNKQKKILIHGLGLNGGGIESARFFLRHGYFVTITDLKDKNRLASQ